MNPLDPDVTVTLPLTKWTAVVQHLGGGVYVQVAELIGAIALQCAPASQAVSQAAIDQATAARAEGERPEGGAPKLNS